MSGKKGRRVVTRAMQDWLWYWRHTRQFPYGVIRQICPWGWSKNNMYALAHRLGMRRVKTRVIVRRNTLEDPQGPGTGGARCRICGGVTAMWCRLCNTCRREALLGAGRVKRGRDSGGDLPPRTPGEYERMSAFMARLVDISGDVQRAGGRVTARDIGAFIKRYRQERGGEDE